VQQVSIFPVDRNLYPVLSAIKSLLFALRHHLYICGHQGLASAMGTNDNRSVMNFPDNITTGIGSLVMKLCAT
jgi:hypothetical protein